MTTQVEDVFEDIPSLGKQVQKMIGMQCSRVNFDVIFMRLNPY
jgi:hypothetical protein